MTDLDLSDLRAKAEAATKTEDDFSELRDLAKRLPPGPWGWFGGESSFYLATKHSGRLYLMAFERRGMNGAQPVFRTGHTITPAADLAQFEVGDKSVVGFKEARKNRSVYRYDVRGFDNDVAKWMAAANPSTILSLIDRVERLEEALKLVHRLFLPIHMQLAEAELCDEFVSDGTVLFSFMGSGASDHVTVGDYRKAIESVRSALTPDT